MRSPSAAAPPTSLSARRKAVSYLSPSLTYPPLTAAHDIHRPPTTSEAATLRRIPAKVPSTAYFLAVVEMAERASYYGVSGVFTNFVQRPLPPGSTTGAPASGSEVAPGALGMGLRASAAVTG